MAANMWQNNLKNVESDNNKILYEALLDFLQRNGTYFLNKPRSVFNMFRTPKCSCKQGQLGAQFILSIYINLYVFRATMCLS